MKKQIFLVCIFLVMIAQIIGLAIFVMQDTELSQDSIAVNEVMQSVKQDFFSLDKHTNTTTLDYVILDENEALLYATKSGLTESINQAIKHRDTILDVNIDNVTVGKVIIYNNDALSLQTQKQTIVLVLAIAIVIECSLCIGYTIYVHNAIIRPFGKLKGFAERVAGGNLDIPLEMDRKNLFGAFTESFDIMRTELKKARTAEAQANKSKKELVAKLSHDIKTPIASIKAVSEVGYAVTGSEKDRVNYAQIIGKADQINTLVANLFTATLEDLQQLTVSPDYIESVQIKAMLENADYLHKAQSPEIPECLVYADGLRLQQVFDNIFANSYKYANTQIIVSVQNVGGFINITVEDFGGGVLAEELPTLKEKYKRGTNSKNIEGAGLGLFISDYFMNEMQGYLNVNNGEHGLKVTVSLKM